MTTDHTPAEAGTANDLQALARELRNLDAMGKQVASVHLSRWARTIEEHRCSPPVTPGDTATERGDVRRRVLQVLYDAGMTETPPEHVYRALFAADLFATAGTEGEAGRDADLTALVPSIEAELFAPLDPFGTGRVATLDERLRPLVHARLMEWAADATASSQGEAQGQGECGTCGEVHGLRMEPHEDPKRPTWECDGSEHPPRALRFAAPRAVAPVGNVDREVLAEAPPLLLAARGLIRGGNVDREALAWRQVGRDDVVTLPDGRVRYTRTLVRVAPADVALAALRGEES